MKFKIESIDTLCRSDYEGKLSKEDAEFLQVQCKSINYEIRNDAELTIQFQQSYRSIELLTKMFAEYDIELCYSNHAMKFKRCVFDSIRSITSSRDVLVEVKFICEAKPGLPIEFEHIKIDD
jgi:hypothetical protein